MSSQASRGAVPGKSKKLPGRTLCRVIERRNGFGIHMCATSLPSHPHLYPHPHHHQQDSYPADVGTSESEFEFESVPGSVWNLNKLIRCIRHILAGEEVEG